MPLHGSAEHPLAGKLLKPAVIISQDIAQHFLRMLATGGALVGSAIGVSEYRMGSAIFGTQPTAGCLIRVTSARSTRLR